MKNSISLALSIVALGLVGAQVASAGSASTAPVPGSYKGPAKSIGYEGYVETGPAEAKVSHAAGPTSISLEIYGLLNCGNNEGHPLQVTVTAKSAGTAFSHVGSAEDIDGNLVHYRLNGKFTKPTSFKGTLKASGEFDFAEPEKAKCTADISFTLYKSKP